MISLCLSLLVVGFAIGLPVTWLCRGMAVRVGAVDQPGHRKIHDRPIPVLGGVGIFTGLVLPILLGLAAAHWAPVSWWEKLSPASLVHLPGLRSQTPMALALLGVIAALHIMGLIDDRRNLGPRPKLIVQLAAAGAMVGLFPDMRLLEMAGPWLSIAVTILWLAAITNAFNFIDNMDGLAGGVTVICGSIFLAAALLGGQWFVAAVLALVVGSTLGFLMFNFPPASIFMGDGGSLVIGFTLAFCAVRLTYADLSPDAVEDWQWWAVFTPVVVLAIPLYDLTSVTLIRLSQGKSPFVGDRQHFSHRLVKRGLSRPAAVAVIYACTAATGIGGVMLGRVPGWAATMIVVQTMLILLVLALLERADNGKD